MFILGLTGSIAGGKTTAAKLLQQQGLLRIDADELAKRTTEIPEVVAKLASHFGDEILLTDGRLDRKRLGQIVFGAPNDQHSQQALVYLEGIIHPVVRRRITADLRQAISQQRSCVVLDIPLLFESGWDRSCDAVWYIDAAFDLRQARVKTRGWDTDELKRREANQWPVTKKRRLSNLVIENDKTLKTLSDQIQQAWKPLFDQLPQLSTTDAHCGQSPT